MNVSKCRRTLGVRLLIVLMGLAVAQSGAAQTSDAPDAPGASVSEPPAMQAPAIGAAESGQPQAPSLPQTQAQPAAPGSTAVETGAQKSTLGETGTPAGANPAENSAANPGAAAPLSDTGSTPKTPSVAGAYVEDLSAALPDGLRDEAEAVQAAVENSERILRDGGPSIWAIALLSVITVALILWKVWRLSLVGAWSRGRASKAVAAYEVGNVDEALGIVSGRRALRSKVVFAAITARRDKSEDLAREETLRVAKNELAEASVGLRALELIATIAPLLGLLGTVLGMIAAFQALQESGSRADPALLAGGIWEALLTTAAGMAVAIPASAALSWFESVIDRLRRDMEDAASRIFVTDLPTDLPTRSEQHDSALLTALSAE